MNVVIQWIAVGVIVAAAAVYLAIKLSVKSKDTCGGCCENCVQGHDCDDNTGTPT